MNTDMRDTFEKGTLIMKPENNKEAYENLIKALKEPCESILSIFKEAPASKERIDDFFDWLRFMERLYPKFEVEVFGDIYNEPFLRFYYDGEIQFGITLDKITDDILFDLKTDVTAMINTVGTSEEGIPIVKRAISIAKRMLANNSPNVCVKVLNEENGYAYLNFFKNNIFRWSVMLCDSMNLDAFRNELFRHALRWQTEDIFGPTNSKEKAVEKYCTTVNETTVDWHKEYIDSLRNDPIINVEDVIFNDPATIIKWKDGTKTVVKATKGEPYDPEKGLCMAILKHMWGKNYYKRIKKLCEGYYENHTDYLDLLMADYENKNKSDESDTVKTYEGTITWTE